MPKNGWVCKKDFSIAMGKKKYLHFKAGDPAPEMDEITWDRLVRAGQVERAAVKKAADIPAPKGEK